MKLDINTFMVIILIGVLFFFQNTPTPVVQTQQSANINDLVNAGVIFRVADSFNSGTSLNTEFVRVLKGDQDLGSISANSGTLSVTPSSTYKFYFGLNSSAYYPSIKTYTATAKESDQIVSSSLCKIDTAPTLATFDESGNLQTSSAYAQSISASQVKTVYVQIVARNDRCYGMPDSGSNAICFAYDSTAFSQVETNTGHIGVPSSIADITAGSSVSCYKFNALKDNEMQKIPVTLTATTTEPTNAHNISVYFEDISFTLSEDDLSEIYGYEDEDGNNLSATYQETKIYIS